MKTIAVLIANCLVAMPVFAQETAVTPPISATQTATPLGAATVDPGYVFGSGDEVRISVYGEPDLTTQAKLGPTGEIAAPLIGVVNAGGMTGAQLEQTLGERYRQGFLVNPRVTVAIAAYRPFYIIGEVANPGAYSYAPQMTATNAIAVAGGFTSRANRGRVFLRRAGETTERSVSVAEAISVGPGDTIRVGTGAMAFLSDLPLGLLR